MVHPWGEWVPVIFMAEYLCCPLKTITILLIGYTTIQTKKFKIKERDQGANFEYVI